MHTKVFMRFFLGLLAFTRLHEDAAGWKAIAFAPGSAASIGRLYCSGRRQQHAAAPAPGAQRRRSAARRAPASRIAARTA